jgi:hypothetical protein
MDLVHSACYQKDNERRRLNLENKLTPDHRSKQEHRLYAVMGQDLAGNATALIIAATEADAEYYALHELGFVTVSKTTSHLINASGG